MPMTPGYYMPTMYGNAYYPQTGGAALASQNAYAQAPQNHQGIQWVDGEVGAKAFQMPQGWPSGTPIPLWDTNDTVIYLKSINQMGMPNPLQKIHYTMDEQPKQLPSGSPEPSNFVTKDEMTQLLEDLKKDMRNFITGNQNGTQNRGGSK